MRETVAILGIPVDCLAADGMLDRIDQFIRERRFHQVATANADFLLNATRDPELRDILRDSDLVTADGMPVVWAARLLGSRLPERVTGADLVPSLARLAAERGYSIYMLGARAEVAERARQKLMQDNPGLRIVGCASPEIPSVLSADCSQVLQDIARARPDILLVAFGNPKQEKWIRMYREELRDVPVCMGVGGTFDFLSGNCPRAPRWMQSSGLEWMHRLASDPRRLWRRYAADLLFFPALVASQAISMRAVLSRGRGRLAETRLHGCTVVSVRGRMDTRGVQQLQAVADRALNRADRVLVDIGESTPIDGAALGTLVNLAKRAASRESELCVVTASPSVRRLFSITRAEERVRVCSTLDAALDTTHAPALEMRVSHARSMAQVTLHGRATEVSAYAVEDRLRRLPPNTRLVVLDLRDVTYIDSAMLSVLYRFNSDVQATGRSVRILPGTVVLHAVEREGLTSAFQMEATPLRAARVRQRRIAGANVEHRR